MFDLFMPHLLIYHFFLFTKFSYLTQVVQPVIGLVHISMNSSISKIILFLLILQLTLSCGPSCFSGGRRGTPRNHIRNGEFSRPRIPPLQSQILFTGQQCAYWSTTDFLYLKKYRVPNTLFFKQALLLNHTSSIQQWFNLQGPTKVDVTILYTTKNCPKQRVEVGVFMNDQLLGKLVMGKESTVQNGIFQRTIDVKKDNKFTITVTKMDTILCRVLIKKVKATDLFMQKFSMYSKK